METAPNQLQGALLLPTGRTRACRQRSSLRGYGRLLFLACCFLACEGKKKKKNKKQGKGNGVTKQYTNTLRPSQVADMEVFDDYINETTVTLPFGDQDVAEGSIEHKGLNHTSHFEVLPSVVTQEEIASILALVDDEDLELDADPDTVDGMATHEIFVESSDLYERSQQGWMPGMKLDSNAEAVKQRKPLRAKLKRIMDPILSERITPYIRQRYPDVCGKDVVEGRQCTPCYSLIRRYRPDERQSHASHHDGHALVTAVISLSDYGSEYRGGLYVATGRSANKVVALRRGDAVVHQSDLLHGVKVKEDGGTRWSWILWYRDSATCDDSVEHEWFEECAEEGSAVCEMLYATKVGGHPGLSEAEQFNQVMEWNKKSAAQGLSESMIKIARAYLKQLPSSLQYDRAEAKRIFKRAVERNAEPEAYFGLAQLLVEDGADHLNEAVSMLEGAAAKGNVFAMFNLGIAHLYGYGVAKRDPDLAAEWFGTSGLPEGMVCVGMYRRAKGDVDGADGAAVWEERARKLGYGSTWRQDARKRTGSGGVGGVEMNLKWPPMADGSVPPTW